MKALRMLVCSILPLMAGTEKSWAPTPAMADAAPSARQWTSAQEFARQYRPILRADSIRLSDSLAYQIVLAADKHGIERQLAFQLVWVESRFKPDAVSPVGALGLTQVMPRTGQGVCALTPRQLHEAEHNLDCGFTYLAQLLSRYDNVQWLALVAYYRGPYRADQVRALGLGYPENILTRAAN